MTVHTDANAVRRRQGRCGGYQVTEVNGQPDTSAADGTELYFHVSAGVADGKASLTTMMTTQVPVDRAFASASKGQAQILAGSTESAITTDATANSVVKDAVPSAFAFFAALLPAMAPTRFGLSCFPTGCSRARCLFFVPIGLPGTAVVGFGALVG